MPIPTASAQGQLLDVFSDLLGVGSQIAKTKQLGNYSTFRIKVEQMFQSAERRGAEKNIPQETLVEAKFAVVSFVDEMILHSGWEHREEWASNRLEYQFFSTNTAGEEFFTRLDSHRRALPINPDLLEIYHTCLILGFEGKYKMHQRERIKDLKHDLFREIQERRGEPTLLSPHAQRREEALGDIINDFPAWVVTVCGVSIIVFSFGAFSVLADLAGTELLEYLNQLARAIR